VAAPKYASQAAGALKSISAKGGDVTFVRAGTASYDPVTQVEVTANTTLTMKGVALPPGKSAEFRVGSLANRRLIELHLAPKLGPCPLPGDKLVWAGFDWTVVWVSELNPAGDGAPYCLAYAER
jgi:hypothetical protein